MIPTAERLWWKLGEVYTADRCRMCLMVVIGTTYDAYPK